MSDKATIAALQRNLADAEVERLRLVEEVKRLEEPRLRSLHVENGAIEMSIEESTGIVHRMAAAMATMFEDCKATNYFQQEMTLNAKEYVLLVRPLTRPTPHELRQQAEQRAADLEAQLAASHLTAQRMAVEAVAEEREACASLIEKHPNLLQYDAEVAAAAIRARGGK